MSAGGPISDGRVRHGLWRCGAQLGLLLGVTTCAGASTSHGESDAKTPPVGSGGLGGALDSSTAGSGGALDSSTAGSGGALDSSTAGSDGATPERDAGPDSRQQRRDAGPSGPFDAAVCGLPEESGDPPPDCIAPCMWQVMKECHLSRCCVIHEPFPGATFRCDAKGVQQVSARGPGMTGASNATYYPDGSLCYQLVAAGGTFASPIFNYVDGANRAFATMQWVSSAIDGGEPTQRVTCSGQVFDVIPSQLKCAPWTRLECAPGTCPTPF